MLASQKRILPFAGVARRCLLNSPVVAPRIPMACAAHSNRFFAASTAGAKVAKVLQAEVKHEDEQYEQAKEIKAFLRNSDFKLAETDGDVNMSLSREVGGRVVQIEWQLTSPFDPMADAEGEEDNMEQEATDFCVTIENKSSGAGVSFYCSTQAGEEHRYVIGNVKMFANAEEKESASSFNGPEFEDLDDKVQESFDEFLADAGLNREVCDFIDAMALDKEQREYIRWLKNAKMFFES
eukprot:TRINITY_DN164_c0_g1_i1.p1 TRINITY_DN164_c0_g1~~TRINITY_DN164_c0_g1_i1.p1  ORF type:complete len:260 (+),score=52.95 TRINITY_DN164_c0_g1_i1:69-782(+)